MTFINVHQCAPGGGHPSNSCNSPWYSLRLVKARGVEEEKGAGGAAGRAKLGR